MLLSQVPSFSSLLIELYIPKYFFTHAASLHQSFLHCAIFPTAASRRSLGRVSVPMWPYILSDRLLIVALVGRYPANWLIRRGSILYRITPFPYAPCSAKGLCGISSRFQLLSPCTGQVTHALLTRPPLSSSRKKNFVRLACVKHAASVYPEPGSNSHVQFSVQFCANAFLSVCVSYLKDFTVFIGCSLYYAKNFTRLTAFAIWLFKKSSGLVILFNYQGSFVISFSTHSYCSLTVHYFIISSCIFQALFSNFFWFLLCQSTVSQATSL